MRIYARTTSERTARGQGAARRLKTVFIVDDGIDSRRVVGTVEIDCDDDTLMVASSVPQRMTIPIEQNHRD